MMSKYPELDRRIEEVIAKFNAFYQDKEKNSTNGKTEIKDNNDKEKNNTEGKILANEKKEKEVL